MLSLDGTQYGNDALPRFPVSEQAMNHDHWTLSEAKCDASPDVAQKALICHWKSHSDDVVAIL
jgi:hypothetical protein